MRVTSAAALQALGERVGRALFPGAVVLLRGGLGAGKTTFAQGVARGAGVVGPVQSPTYALVHEYPGAHVPLRHADVYRLEAEAELVSAGLAERVGEDGAWLVEWADRFPDAWPPGRLEVELVPHPEGRELRVTATDAAHAALAAALVGA